MLGIQVRNVTVGQQYDPAAASGEHIHDSVRGKLRCNVVERLLPGDNNLFVKLSLLLGDVGVEGVLERGTRSHHSADKLTLYIAVHYTT